MSLLSSLILAASLQTPAWEADLNLALGKIGLTQETAKIDPTILGMFQKGEFAPSLYTALSADPWRTPIYTAVKRAEFAKAVGKPSDLLSSGGQWLGWGVRRTLLGNPNAALEAEAKKPESLKAVLDQMVKMGWISKPLPDLKSIPKEVQSAAALVLSSCLAVQPSVKAALAKVGDLKTAHQVVEASVPGETDPFGRQLDLYRSFNTSSMAAAGHDLAAASQTAAEWAAAVPFSVQYDVRIETTQGSIVLRGGSDDDDNLGPTLLVIDTGGDDLTIGAANAGPQGKGISVHIDTIGDDSYLSDAALAQTSIDKWEGRKGATGVGPASATLGLSVLIDGKGDDLYRSHRPAFGSARFGCSILLDKMGDDLYDTYTDSLGFGHFGGGILEDLGGNDTYLGFYQVQGTGVTMGLGLLADRGGNDTYTANDSLIDFPSAQSAQHNISMSQGAGFGRRADYSDGRSMAGGVGVLMDSQGDDTYSCGVFGQGVGYWMGVGLLWDLAGKDSYSGQWYSQGASAHFAVGIIEDESGDDSYLAPMNMAQGAGHDFSLGFLRDGGGNDKYIAPNLSFGAGNANGIGWMLEMGGNDTYTSAGITLGKASENPAESLRGRAICLGVFMDLGGTDSYPAASAWAKNAALAGHVITAAPTPKESSLGVFLDK